MSTDALYPNILPLQTSLEKQGIKKNKLVLPKTMTKGSITDYPNAILFKLGPFDHMGATYHIITLFYFNSKTLSIIIGFNSNYIQALQVSTLINVFLDNLFAFIHYFSNGMVPNLNIESYYTELSVGVNSSNEVITIENSNVDLWLEESLQAIESLYPSDSTQNSAREVIEFGETGTTGEILDYYW